MKIDKLSKYGATIFILLLFCYVIYGTFFHCKYLGYNAYYYACVIAIPLLIGLIVLFIVRRKHLSARLKAENKQYKKVILALALLMQGLIVSFFSFTFFATVCWDLINNTIAKNTNSISLYCPISQFWTGKSSAIYFLYNNKTEALHVNYSAIKAYKASPPNKYVLHLKAKPVLLGCFIIEDWEIIHNTH